MGSFITLLLLLARTAVRNNRFNELKLTEALLLAPPFLSIPSYVRLLLVRLVG
jgi:hypothetical protein